MKIAFRPYGLNRPLAVLPRGGRRSRAGFTVVEAITAMAVAVVVSVSAIATLLTAQSFASRARVMHQARVVVQRNIDLALGVRFTGIDNPAILLETASGGAPYQEVAGQPVVLMRNREGEPEVTATMTRTVSRLGASELPAGEAPAVLHRVTFRVDYTYLNRDYSYQLSTIRAQDNQNQ